MSAKVRKSKHPNEEVVILFEQIGLGAEFYFRNSGMNDMLQAIGGMNDLRNASTAGALAMDTFQDSMNNFSQTIGRSGAIAFFKGLAITVANAGAVMKAANFEEHFVSLTKYMSDTSEKGIVDFNNALSSNANNLGVLKSNLMDATELYMSMGLAQDEALARASKDAYAGKIWDVNAQEATASFKAIAAAYKLNFSDMSVTDDFIDKINAVGDKTAATSADILSFMSAAGGTLGEIGNVSVEGSAAMASAARKAEVDVTNLGYAMSTIVRKYSEKGDKLFGAIGVNVRDAKNNMIPFDQALGLAAKKMDTLDQSAKKAFLVDLGERYSSQLAKMMSSWSEYETAMGVALDPSAYTGSAAKEWEKLIGTLNHNLVTTKNLIGDFIQATFGRTLPTITWMFKRLNEGFQSLVNFMNDNPAFGKFLAFGSMLIGVLLIVVGIIALTTAGAIRLSGALAMTATTTGILTGLTTGLATSFGMLRTSLFHVVKSMIPMVLIFGSIALAWKYDMFGIKTQLTNFVGSVKKAFDESNRIASLSAEDMKKELDVLGKSNLFGDKLTLGLLDFKLILEGVISLLKNDFTISDELYKKLDAAGMLETFTNIGLGMLAIKETFEGFKEGFGIFTTFTLDVVKFFDSMGESISKFKSESIDPVLEKFGLMKKSVKGVSDATKGIDTTVWREIGKALGFLAGLAVLGTAVQSVVTIAGALGRVVGLFSMLGGVFSTIWGVITGVWGAIVGLWGTIVSVVSLIGSLVIAVATLFGVVITAPAWLVGAIVLAVAFGIGLVVKFWDEVVAFFGWGIGKVFEGMLWLGTVIGDAIVSMFNGIIKFFADLGTTVGEMISPFVDGVAFAISGMITWISDNAQAIKDALWAPFAWAGEKITNFMNWASESIASLGGTGTNSSSFMGGSMADSIGEAVSYPSPNYDYVRESGATSRNAINNINNANTKSTKSVEVKDMNFNFGAGSDVDGFRGQEQNLREQMKNMLKDVVGEIQDEEYNN